MKLAALDPRVKLLLLFFLSTVSLLTRDVRLVLAVLLSTLLLLFLGGVDLSNAFGRVRGMVGTIFGLFVIQCLFNRQGLPLLMVGDFVLMTDGGLYTAGLVTLRLLIILVSAMIVMTGTSRQYLLALTQWHIPYEIAFMVMVALRFIPMLREEAQDVLCAVQMRGTRLKKTSLRNKASVYIQVMLPIVAGAIERAEQMSIAMEARAFRAKPRRTSLHKLRMGKRDWIYLLGVSLFLAGLVLLSWLF